MASFPRLRSRSLARRTPSPRKWAAILLAATIAPLLTACSVNPTTGRSQFNMLSLNQEIALGEEAKSSLTQEYGGTVQNPQLSAYVTRIGQALAAQTEGDFPNLPWEFTLLDSDVINAFALPGGKVFMSRGLAEKFTTEAELAAVLGHEVGHVTARHGGQRVSQSMVVSGLIIGAGVAASQSDSDLTKIGVPLLVGAGGSGYLLKFNRTQELEADALGVRYMVKVGYDPLGARMVQEVLAREGGGTKQPEFLLTHPYPESRIAQINKLLAGEYAYTQNNPDYNLYQQRYEAEFLSKLSTARRDTSPGQSLASLPLAARLMLSTAALHQGTSPDVGQDVSQSVSWCAHCAWGMPSP